MTMSVPGEDYQVDNRCLSQDGSPKHYARQGPRQSQGPVVLHSDINICSINININTAATTWYWWPNLWSLYRRQVVQLEIGHDSQRPELSELPTRRYSA